VVEDDSRMDAKPSFGTKSCAWINRPSGALNVTSCGCTRLAAGIRSGPVLRQANEPNREAHLLLLPPSGSGSRRSRKPIHWCGSGRAPTGRPVRMSAPAARNRQRPPADVAPVDVALVRRVGQRTVFCSLGHRLHFELTGRKKSRLAAEAGTAYMWRQPSPSHGNAIWLSRDRTIENCRRDRRTASRRRVGGPHRMATEPSLRATQTDHGASGQEIFRIVFA